MPIIVAWATASRPSLGNAFGCSNTAVPSMPFSPWVALLSLNACLVQLLLLRFSVSFKTFTTLYIVIMRYFLHWLSACQRILFRVTVWVWWCQLGSVLSHLQVFCCATSGLVTRRNLPSVASGDQFARTSHRAYTASCLFSG